MGELAARRTPGEAVPALVDRANNAPNDRARGLTESSLYLAIDNDPVGVWDVLGLEVQVWSHSVTLRQQHASLRIYPDDVASFTADNPDIKLYKDAGGREYFTLSAGPVAGRLVSAPNRKSDLHTEPNTFQHEVRRPAKYATDREFINAFIAANRRYSNDLEYSACASYASGYNSNGYVSGLLGGVGTVVPPLQGSFLGIRKPVTIPASP